MHMHMPHARSQVRGATEAASEALGGACWSLGRFPAVDDCWGDRAAAMQRGARASRLLEQLSLASE